MFLLNHPDVKLPPDYLMYESFRLDYERYYKSGQEMAAWIISKTKPYVSKSDIMILDWGCGPGRIIRHIPEFAESGSAFGCDYNDASIAWCKANLPEIDFRKNNLAPPLPYDECYFDLIYGLSIFTHLSEKMHDAWAAELIRALNIGGVLILSTQGNNHRTILSTAEQSLFDKGDLVIRGGVKEGHRVYSAFQPKLFMLNLFSDLELIEFIEYPPEKGKPLAQDIWIFRKSAS